MHSNQCCSNFCSKITNLCIVPTTNSLSTEQMTFTRPAVLSNEAAASTPLTCYGIGHKVIIIIIFFSLARSNHLQLHLYFAIKCESHGIGMECTLKTKKKLHEISILA